MSGIRSLGCFKWGQKSGKWQWRHNFLTWHHHQFFWPCFVPLVKFSYWPRFHVNIITGSGIMTISFCKGLTKNPEIGNTLVWVFPNIWRLGQIMDIKFGTNVSNRMLLNVAKYQGYSFYRFWVIELLRENQLGGKISTPPTQIRVNLHNSHYLHNLHYVHNSCYLHNSYILHNPYNLYEHNPYITHVSLILKFIFWSFQKNYFSNKFSFCI